MPQFLSKLSNYFTQVCNNIYSLSSFQIFIICALISFVINLPTLTVQHTLHTDGVGGDLFFIEAITRGELPYRDFNWIYGPVMLYYNAFFFKVIGHNIHSLIWAKLLLNAFFAGVFFLAARKIMPALTAFLATVTFIVFMPDFQHNFSHYGGVCIEIGILWAVLSYHSNARNKHLLWAALLVLLLGFIKINFGIMFLGGSILCFILCDLFRDKRLVPARLLLYGAALLIICFLWIITYYLFVRGLSLEEIKQCFPIFPDNCYYGGSFSQNLISCINLAKTEISSNHFYQLILIIATICILRILFHLTWNHTCVINSQRNFFLSISILLILSTITLHEYFKARIDYQAFWGIPFFTITIAYLVSETCLISNRAIQLIATLACITIISCHAYQNWKFLDGFKKQEYYFAYKGVDIYTTVNPTDIKTMQETADFINTKIPKDELFLAFPNEPFYYFLTDRKSPSRLIYMIGATNVTPKQQEDLINNMERQHVDYIVLNNICYFGNMWGVFGENNCLILYKYFKENFEEIAQFNNHPIQYWNGTKIFKKKTPAQCLVKNP
ncbi:MAG: hypothetical protein HQL22_08950 [Candidatus Omnitrophica bacterium]|nr:hypothetical protein [Candidatus Omnitrophota bacterium]